MTEESAVAASAATAESGQYKQELRRDLKVFGNVVLCVAAITPAVVVFAIGPVLLNMTGTGAFWAFLIGGVLGTLMAFCWGELGSAYPIAGGDYTVISRTLGRAPGFVSLAITGPVSAFLIPAVVALSIAEYLQVVLPVDAKILGAVVIAIGTVIAIIGVKITAQAVAILLAFEISVVTLVTVLGFAHMQRPLTSVIPPTMFDAAGNQQLVTAGALLAGVVVAAFAYNGFQGALLFSEETKGDPRGIAKAVFISLLVAVVTAAIPVLAGIVGANDLREFTTSPQPWTTFLNGLGNPTLTTIISLGIALSICNGVMALVPYFSRVLFSSGRDNAWPTPVSRQLAKVHPRFETPWVASAAVGIGSIILILGFDVATMATVIGTTIAVEFVLIASAAIASRIRQPDLVRPFRMPLGPVIPIVAAIFSAVLVCLQERQNLIIVAIIVGVSLVYWALYLRPRSDTHLLMLAAPTGDVTEATAAAAAAAAQEHAERD
ncbi:APC family permease [Mycolicibacterium sp. YH-1]|uniref:APC family permease n=1 Tax=Mycolicibacterium sp. YH-1 TaxID=2908837 RepID=UPI001F4C280A|nr:APC family permease [Mycolicibacterium sp. YH-1]UNB52879.1 APC family permease [Mycolicibacterium sp. YH-1]